MSQKTYMYDTQWTELIDAITTISGGTASGSDLIEVLTEIATAISTQQINIDFSNLSSGNIINDSNVTGENLTEALNNLITYINNMSLDVIETLYNNPYMIKNTPSNYYTEKLKNLVGCSFVWNQMVQNGNFANGVTSWIPYSSANSTITANNNILSVTINSTASSGYLQGVLQNNIIGKSGHKYIVDFSIKPPITTDIRIELFGDVYVYQSQIGNQWNKIQSIIAPVLLSRSRILIYPYSIMAVNDIYQIKNVNIIDLTQLFGETIADYVYELEQSNKGSGIEWLNSYGFFTNDYYDYNTGTVESVNVKEKINSDSDNNIIGTYPFDNTVILKGIPSIDSGKLIYDGDIYEYNGTIIRKYESRAYQSGDESLSNAITDGTITVVKLVNPTIESKNPFSQIQIIEDGGTEEFIDYGVENNARDVAIPVGNNSYYGNNQNMGKVVDYIYS